MLILFRSNPQFLANIFTHFKIPIDRFAAKSTFKIIFQLGAYQLKTIRNRKKRGSELLILRANCVFFSSMQYSHALLVKCHLLDALSDPHLLECARYKCMVTYVVDKEKNASTTGYHMI